ISSACDSDRPTVGAHRRRPGLGAPGRRRQGRRRRDAAELGGRAAEERVVTDVPGDDHPGDDPPTADPAGPRTARLTRRGRMILGILAILAVVGLGGGLWLARQVDPAGGPGEKVTVDVDPGTSVAGVAARLDAKGVITSARIFRLYLKLKGGPGAIQAGEDELGTNLSMGDARAAIRRG